jgi:DNA adenine methylase
MIKSPLRYPGGKSRAVKFLKQFIPEFKEYREPMLGGGSMMFYILDEYKITNVKASDINYELYCFWNQLKTSPHKMINEIQKMFENTSDGRKLYSNVLSRRENNLTKLQRAIDFFILNRITFSGVADSGGYSQQSFEHRFTQSSIDRLSKASSIISNVEITHNDFSQLLLESGEDVFIFLDPPYYSVSKSRLYGKKGNLHTEFDHNKFFKTITACNHKWLITYDNCEFIRDIYKNYNQLEWELQYGMNNYKQGKANKGKELLIANYDILSM